MRVKWNDDEIRKLTKLLENEMECAPILCVRRHGLRFNLNNPNDTNTAFDTIQLNAAMAKLMT